MEADSQKQDPSERVLPVSEPQSLITTSQGGAIFQPVHAKRMVKIYPIQEHELLALDDLGRHSTLWTAIGTGALSFSASCFWSMSQNASSSEPAPKALAWLLLVISFASFIAGFSYGKRRKSRLEKIIAECQS